MRCQRLLCFPLLDEVVDECCYCSLFGFRQPSICEASGEWVSRTAATWKPVARELHQSAVVDPERA